MPYILLCLLVVLVFFGRQNLREYDQLVASIAQRAQAANARAGHIEPAVIQAILKKDLVNDDELAVIKEALKASAMGENGLQLEKLPKEGAALVLGDLDAVVENPDPLGQIRKRMLRRIPDPVKDYLNRRLEGHERREDGD